MGNPYLEGNYGPVREELTVTELEVSGRIPEHLDGRYLRNGPNPVAEPDPATYHWFTGTGMVHGIRLRDGRAEWYRNRYVRSAGAAEALGEADPGGPVHAGMDFAANTNVIAHRGRTLALIEAGPLPYELTDELDTVGRYDFGGTLDGSYTAHPLEDPATGELHALSYYWGWGRRVQYSVVGVDGGVRRTVDVEFGASPMMHAFSLTESHVVMFDLPVVFDPTRAGLPVPPAVERLLQPFARRLDGRPTPRPLARRINRRASDGGGFPYRWDPEYQARVGVLPRDGGSDDVRWLDIEPCYVFHPLNAYDEDDRIVVDVARHPRMFDREPLGPNEGPPTLDRWTIDLAAGKVLEERLDDHPMEFPRVDERLTGRRHRYGYGVGFGDPREAGGEPFTALLRHDLVAGTTEARSFGAGSMPSEFVFVPNGDDAPEDDGVLMGFVYDGSTNRSALHILDAATLETAATVQLPTRVPEGFHGNWAPA